MPPARTQIHQEVRLGPGAFGDIRVAAGDLPPYFVEVDYGYSRARVVGKWSSKARSMRFARAARSPGGISQIAHRSNRLYASRRV